MANAMEGGDASQWATASAPYAAQPAPAQFSGGPVARAFHAASAEGASAMPSMAETLRTTFNIGGGAGAVPDHVRSAYSRLSALGL